MKVDSILANKNMFRTDLNIQWNWPNVICPHWSSHLPKTQQVVGSLSYDQWTGNLCHLSSLTQAWRMKMYTAFVEIMWQKEHEYICATWNWAFDEILRQNIETDLIYF